MGLTLWPRGRRPRRLAVTCVRTALGFLVVFVLLAGLAAMRLNQGPIVLPGVGEKIEAALHEKFGNDLAFRIGQTMIVEHGLTPTLALDKLTISGADGQTVLMAPKAEISVDPFALLIGRVVPKRLEVFDVTLKMALLKNGNLAIAAGDGSAPFFRIGPTSASAPAPPGAGAPNSEAPPPPASSPVATPSPRRAAAMKAAAAALRQFLDLLTDPRSAIAAVDRLAIERGTLTIEDEESGQRTVYSDFDLAFDKKRGTTTFDLAATGPDRRWSIAAQATGTPGNERTFALDVKDLSVDELQFATGTRFSVVETDAPIAAHFELGVKPDDTLRAAVGAFSIGPGFVRIVDPDQEPQFITAIDGHFHWNGAARQIELDSAHYIEGGSHLAFTGQVTPPVHEGEPWRVAIANLGEGIIAPERKGQVDVPITKTEFAARLMPEQKLLLVDRLVVQSVKGGIAMSGQVDWNKGPHIRIGASIDPTPVRVAERLWPSFAGAPVRAWVLSHFEDGLLTSGTMQIDMDSESLVRLRSDRGPVDAAVSLDFTVSNGRLKIFDGVPPLDKLEGSGHITGRTTHLVIGSATIDADGKPIAVSDGTFTVPNSNVHPVLATVSAHLAGSVEAVDYLLTRDALKPFASVPLDPATLHGTVDGRLDEILTLDDEGPDGDDLKVNAKVSNLVIDKLIGKEGLDNGAVTIVVENGALKATGQGRIFGSQATFEIDRVGGLPPSALIGLTLDDAARAKLGLSAIPGVSGPIAAKVEASLGDPSKIKAQVELDLGKASVVSAFLGLNKPVGKAAKVSFSVAPGDDKMVVDPLVIDVASLQARGTVELGADNAFSSARFSSLKVSPGDDMKVEIAKADDMFKLTVRGTTIDARPFLKALTSTPTNESNALSKTAKAEKKEAESFKGFDIDLKSGILTGFNKEVMTGVDLKLAKRGAQIRQLAVQGSFGRGGFQGSMAADQTIRLSAKDSGALLSFIDLYKHMEGGQLSTSMKVGEDTLSGALEIQNFVLRDEPAIRQLVATSTEVSAPGQDADAARRINAGAVGFKRLKVNFARDGSRLELRDATMYGSEIGLSVDGWLDYSHDRVAMNGTFVPAFAINNLFSQIPVLGMVLGGKSNEGLLAITFKISGLASSPTLSINPLSAITPGFLRNIFGVLDNPNGAPAPAR